MLFFATLFSTGILISSSQFEPTQHRNFKLFEHEKCGLSHTDRIIGGKNASRGAYPWLARIGYTTTSDPNTVVYKCGGVLISTRYVVTAAHCVTKLPKEYKVGAILLGEHNTQTDPDCEDDGVCVPSLQLLKPEEITTHDQYGKPAFKNDIALIRLNASAEFTDYVMPICIISGELMTKDFVNEVSEVAGWGIWDMDDPKPSVILQTIKLPIVENSICKEAFKFHAQIGPTQMCVGGKVGEDSCGGDSGGPLMKVEATGTSTPKYYMIGIVSFGAKRCGATTMPGVYTRMSSFMEWIMDHMHE